MNEYDKGDCIVDRVDEVRGKSFPVAVDVSKTRALEIVDEAMKSSSAHRDVFVAKYADGTIISPDC